MSIRVHYCPTVSVMCDVIMNITVNKMRRVTRFYYNYSMYLSLYVFICTCVSLYTQHYGGRDA
jgi:hypothetical protein